jgi:hypothetical protein
MSFKKPPASSCGESSHVLKHRGPAALARMADRLTEQETALEDIHEHVSYVRKRLSFMNYPLFRRVGWPIGSGMVGEWGERQQACG